MNDVLSRFPVEVWQILLELSPSQLLGLFIAGVLVAALVATLVPAVDLCVGRWSPSFGQCTGAVETERCGSM